MRGDRDRPVEKTPKFGLIFDPFFAKFCVFDSGCLAMRHRCCSHSLDFAKTPTLYILF